MSVDSRRLALIAANSSALRGLMVIPFSVFFLAVFLFLPMVPETPEALRGADPTPILLAGTAVTVLFAAAIVTMIFARAYYRRRFGPMKPTTRMRVLGGLLGALGGGGFSLSLNLNVILGDPNRPLPVNAPVLVIAALFAIWWALTARVLTHYLALALLGLIIGLAPLLGIGVGNRWAYLREATLYIALITGVGGYLDHRMLTQTLGVRWSSLRAPPPVTPG